MTPAHDATPRWLPLLGIVVIAVNLRPAITAVGPVLPMLGEELRLSAFELGLLGALPVAVFSLASSVVGHLVRRLGVERTATLALGVLTVATVLRSWPGPEANLWVGTVIIGAAIAVGNVTVPVIVKRDFASAAALVTGVYVAVLGIFAGLAAALAVPLAAVSTLTWRLSLGGWAVLTVLGLIYWLPQSRASGGAHRPGAPAVPADAAAAPAAATPAGPTPAGATPPGSASAEPTPAGSPSAASTPAASTPAASTPAARGTLWRNRDAWLLSCYMGVQSTTFYVALTWLPTVEQELGYSGSAAGWHMFLLQVLGIVGNFLAPALMRVGRDQRFTAILPGVFMVLGSVGMVLAPGGALLWVSVLGLGTGTAFVVSLTLIAVRAGDMHTAPRLSAMAQSIGYAITASGLLAAGVLHILGPSAVPLLIAGFGLATASLGTLVGRDRRIG